MQKSTKSLTDWDRVRKAYESDAPIPYDPEDGPYDPNDDAAVDAYWAKATIIRPNHRGPQKAPVKKQVSLRLSPEVLEYFKSTGKGWQTRIDETLKKAIEPKRRRKAS
jgi:uncharacterized protein (DUF4415 family)